MSNWDKFLPLYETVASTAVFVIVSGSGGLAEADGNAFGANQITPGLCVNGKLVGTNGRAIEWAYPDPLNQCRITH